MATDLPELRRHIAQYLDFDTLKAFSVVCKAWHLDAQPILWSLFECQVPQECSASPKEYTFWLDTLRKNAISFRHICYVEDKEPIAPEIRDILLGQCHSVDSIMMDISSRRFRDPVCGWEETLGPLIRQNRVTLRQLELRWNDNYPMTFLPSLVASLPHLRSLEVSAFTMMVKDVFPILDACPSSLQRLALDVIPLGGIRFDEEDNQPDYSSIPPIATPLRLKSFSMPYFDVQGSTEEILSRLAVHSLQDFRIQAAYCLQISPTVRDALWRLTSLTVEESRLQSGDERALPGILEAIHPHQLRRVNVDRMTGENIAKLIEKQHQSLETLSVQLDNGHTGALADILATCSRLKSLTFKGWPFVNIGALIDPQKPWVCTELEVFEGRFGLWIPDEEPPRGLVGFIFNKSIDVKTSRRIEEQFMLRLGLLTHLRYLVQNMHSREAVERQLKQEGMKQRTMEWSLASGLGHLHGLVNLRAFKILDQDPRNCIGLSEMRFIKQHWQSLREMVCDEIGGILVQVWLATEWPELEATNQFDLNL
ncbi:MAG: hypothetical protein J3Q66DRAFT_406805 [Benniella sp.]|nr:MAG: hypothetical protein J3Q66DRAFT_406805 [Benniella sp.]